MRFLNLKIFRVTLNASFVLVVKMKTGQKKIFDIIYIKKIYVQG